MGILKIDWSWDLDPASQRENARSHHWDLRDVRECAFLLIMQNAKTSEGYFSTLSEACAVEIMTLIRNGEYPPGTKLSEYSLAKRINFGLSPIKMALNRLAEGGILERRNRSGTYVRSITTEEYLSLLDIRIRMEGLSAYQATTKLTASELKQLEKLAIETDAFTHLTTPGEGIQKLKSIQKDMDFHMRIARATQNRFLVEILDRQHILHICFLFSLQISPAPSKELLSGVGHAQIVEAFKQRDPALAEQLMQRHIGRIREFLK